MTVPNSCQAISEADQFGSRRSASGHRARLGVRDQSRLTCHQQSSSCMNEPCSSSRKQLSLGNADVLQALLAHEIGHEYLTRAISELPMCPLCAHRRRSESRATARDLAGCSALHYNCSARIGGPFRGRSDHGPSAHTVGSDTPANSPPPGTSAVGRRPHGARGVPSGSTVSRR